MPPRDRQPFMILGASGAGKSSLLKAGIIPRLRREAPAWLPLRAFRPGADPLLNFAEALARTLTDFGKVEAHGAIRDRLFDAWSKAERNGNELTPAGRASLDAALEAEGRKLRDAAGRGGACILISVDQAEEIARAEGDSGDALADYLRSVLAASATNWQIAFTIRTDSFPELQSHRRFQNLEARGYDLRAIPVLSLRERRGGAGEALRRRGRSCARRCADRRRAEGRRPSAAGFCASAPVAPVRRLGSLDQR